MPIRVSSTGRGLGIHTTRGAIIAIKALDGNRLGPLGLTLGQVIEVRTSLALLPLRVVTHGLVVGLLLLAATAGAIVRPAIWVPLPIEQSDSVVSSWWVPPQVARQEVLVKPPSPLTNAANKPRKGVTVYTIKQGDALSSIAELYDVTMSTIVWANQLDESLMLTPGRQLVILPVSGVFHTVAPEEHVDDIAAKYQSDANAIVEFNQLTSPDAILPGDRLVVPGGRLPEPEVPATAAESSPAGVGLAIAASASQPAPGVPVAPAALAPPPRQALRAFTYVVQPGDSLGAIAGKFGLDNKSILWANELPDPEVIPIGKVLTVPPVSGVLHKVREGDTLNTIAQVYDADPDAIIEANLLRDPSTIVLGTQLVIPGGQMPQPVRTPAPPAAPAPAPAPAPRAAPAQPAAPAAPKPAPAPALPANISLGERVAGIGAKFVGYRYVWGGHSPSGFDCSGFVWYVYQQAGISLPIHDLWGQLASGPRISQDKLFPGDIVFFVNTYQPGLSHNGIYIGGGRFVNAVSEGKGVAVSNLYDSYWGPRYFGASRPW